MPAIVPKHMVQCAEGHKMFFRTIPLPQHEGMMILGCDGDGCYASVLVRLKQIAADFGIQTA